MGLLTKTAQAFGRKDTSMGAMIPTWQMTAQQLPDANYETFARDGYSHNDIVFACIEELATSAAEPRIVGVRKTGAQTDKIFDHEVVAMLRRPNRFCSGYDYIATIIRHLAIAGNSYSVKVRSGAGKLVELWIIRPDRMRVIPDRQKFLKGYRYINGDIQQDFDLQDVIHIKNFSARNDFYGDPPLLAAAEWVDIDSWMRKFVKAFFQNAGVPSGILTTSRSLQHGEKESVREAWRAQFSGPGGWNKVALFEANETTYTPMGLPLGGRGLVVPELEEIATSRIGAAFRVPPSILGSRLGLMKGNYASREADFQTLWLQTLVPLYARIQDALSLGIFGDPQRGIPGEAIAKGIDAVEFDMSTVKAMRADDDSVHKRWNGDYTAGIASQEEARQHIGLPPDPDPGHHFYLPPGVTVQTGDQLGVPIVRVLPPLALPAGKSARKVRV